MKLGWLGSCCLVVSLATGGKSLAGQDASVTQVTGHTWMRQTSAVAFTPFAPSLPLDAGQIDLLVPPPSNSNAASENDGPSQGSQPGAAESGAARSQQDGQSNGDQNGQQAVEQADEQDLQQRLDALVEEAKGYGEQIDGLTEDLESLTEEVESFTGDPSVVHSGGSRNTMRVSGRIHVDHWAFPTAQGDIPALEGEEPQDRLLFRRVRFGVGGELVGNMLYRIEIEFAGGNATEFRDVFIGWEELPFFDTVLIGYQKRPYGLDHLNSSRYNVFLERPFIIESFNQDSRRLGICSYGFSEDLRWNWRYGVFNTHVIQHDGIYIGDDLQMEFASRLANTIWYDEVSGGRGYAHWAISHTWASPDAEGGASNEARFRHRPEARSTNRWIDTGVIAGAHDYHLLGLEGVVNVGPLQVVSEYQNVWVSRHGALGPDVRFHGAYVYAAYFLTGEHMPWDRESGTLERIRPFENFFLVNRCDGGVGNGLGAWQIAVRYSYGDLIDEDITGGLGKAMTVGLNWYMTPTARMQFNWMHGAIENNAGRTGDYDIVGTRLMVDF